MAPRGFGADPGARKSANRELKEEIGASGIRLTELGKMYPDTGASNSVVALFQAEISSHGKPDEAEAITEIISAPVAEFERTIGDCELDDGYLLAACGRAKARNLP